LLGVGAFVYGLVYTVSQIMFWCFVEDVDVVERRYDVTAAVRDEGYPP
jgi:hypothetical protein